MPGSSDPAQSAPLEVIAEMTESFAATRDIDAALLRALARITQHIGAAGGSLFLLDGDFLVCHASVGPHDLGGLRLGRNEGIVGRCVGQNACELVRDVQRDPAFQQKVDQQTGFTTRSILCASLSAGAGSLGAIELVNKQTGDGLFDEADRDFLRTLAAGAGLALANARLTERLVEQERLRRELELAAEIQRSLLPAEQPPPFPVAGINRPARGVSGDFYAWLELPGERIAFALGDVSGKGMNAALLMAQTAGAYRCLARSAASPGDLLARINEEICATATRGMFVTLVVGELDLRTRRLRFANAGHEPPLLARRDGGFESFPAAAPPIGIDPSILGGAPFPECEVELGEGALYLYSDGLTESVAGGEPIGADGVRARIEAQRELPPAERIERIVEDFADAPGRDDITLLVIDPESARRSASEPRRLLHLRIPARAGRLREVRSRLEQALQGAGVDASCAQEVVLAVDEALQNTIRHAYGGDCDEPIEVEARREGDALCLEVRDRAPSVDPERIQARPLDALRPGGLGVHFIRSVMHETRFLPDPSGRGNVLRMRRRLD